VVSGGAVVSDGSSTPWSIPSAIIPRPRASTVVPMIPMSHIRCRATT